MRPKKRSKKLLLLVALPIAIFLFLFLNRPRMDPISKPRTVRVQPIPDSAAIVFWSTRGAGKALGPAFLFTMAADGRDITQITFDPEPYEHAAVSYDRRYLAADRHHSGFFGTPPYSLWVFDLERKTEARLVPGFYAAGGGGMDWSPDGFLYFAGEPRKDAGRNIYKVRPDGSGLTRLTDYVLKPTPPPDPAQTGDVSVSEDGSTVAYVRIRTRKVGDQYLPNPQIWAMNADGSRQRMVYNGGERVGDSGSRDAIGAFDPEISPDGSRIVFSQTNLGFRNFASEGVNTAHDVFTIGIDGTGLRRLTPPGPVCIIPDWTDRKILFTEYSEPARYVGLATMNPDGTDLRRLETGVELWRGGRHGKFIPPVKRPVPPAAGAPRPGEPRPTSR